MKKVLMILGALLLGVSAFAQKGNFKKNTLSEGLGITIPIGSWATEGIGDGGYVSSGAQISLNYQRSFSEGVGLSTSFNYGTFQATDGYLNDLLDITGCTSVNGRSPRYFNLGVGIFTSKELGNSGFFIESDLQLIVGLFKDEELNFSGGSYSAYLNQYGTSSNYFQIGAKIGASIYKMFGNFGVGLDLAELYTTPKAENFSYTSGGLIDYLTCQLKLVQKF